MSPTTVYLVMGLSLLLAVVLSTSLGRFPVSAPIVLVGVGILIGLTPLADGLDADPVAHRSVVEHFTEVTVLVALMGVGLALDRPLSLRDRASWRHWSPTWRLLFVAMPLTIAGVALLGWWALGLAPASALLLGAALAPTDPVLASDVQVEGPRVRHRRDEIDEEDEVRFALTSEAGLNDGLAFPFVTAAVLLAGGGSVLTWGWQWLGWDLVGNVGLGVLVGCRGRPGARRGGLPSPAGVAAAGRAAATRSWPWPRSSRPTALSELVHGYGFLAVFACAMTVRAADRTHGYHEAMHGVVERLERLLTLLVLLAARRGDHRAACSTRLDGRGVPWRWSLVLVLPPAGRLPRAGRPTPRRGPRPAASTRARPRSPRLFGVRGIGIDLLRRVCRRPRRPSPTSAGCGRRSAFTIVLSVFVHGVAATPAMAWLERRERTA